MFQVGLLLVPVVTAVRTTLLLTGTEERLEETDIVAFGALDPTVSRPPPQLVRLRVERITAAGRKVESNFMATTPA